MDTDRSTDDVAAVPLVVYVEGRRHVIGEATVREGEVSASIGNSEMGGKVMDLIMGRPDLSHFSLAFDDAAVLLPYEEGRDRSGWSEES